MIGFAVVVLSLFTLNLQLSTELNFNKELVFEVESGEGFNQVLSRLSRMVPGFPVKASKMYLKLTKKEDLLKVSEYEIPENSTAYEILNYLVKGQVVEKRVTIQEGFNIYQIAQLMESKGLCSAKDFIEKTRDLKFISDQLGYEIPTLEGYLFPDTYRLPKKWTAEQYIEVFLRRHLKVWKSIEDKYSHGMSHHQVVILASMIEKETGAGFERPMISSVFQNRLKKSMRLQSDPTTIYGVWVKTGKMLKNITRKDLQTSTPYNTYTVTGLPFGPIANPGKAALIAAIVPARSKNYYFVSKNDGTHKFSRTYHEHLAAVRKFQLDPKAREGKSWRDLKKD